MSERVEVQVTSLICARCCRGEVVSGLLLAAGPDPRCEVCGEAVTQATARWQYRGRTEVREVDAVIDGGRLGPLLVETVATVDPRARWTLGSVEER